MSERRNILVFTEIRRNRFGRIWAIKQKGKIIHKGYNFVFGRELFEKLKTEGVGLWRKMDKAFPKGNDAGSSPAKPLRRL